jgi:hypothetical protein
MPPPPNPAAVALIGLKVNAYDAMAQEPTLPTECLVDAKMSI